MAKTFRTLSAEDWDDIRFLVQLAEEQIEFTQDESSTERFRRAVHSLVSLSAEWDEAQLQATIVR